MLSSTFKNIAVEGISVALPTQKVAVDTFIDSFGEEVVSGFKSMTGVESISRAKPEQTASDLGYEAALNLLNKTNCKTDDIGILIFVTQKPDFRVPSTAFLLHKRLGLSEDCTCFDINLACSGFVYGLQTAFSMLDNSKSKKALLITADTSMRTLSPIDRSMIMLFGDSGSATLVEKKICPQSTRFAFKTDGKRFKSIVTPAGAYRTKKVPNETVIWEDGIERSYYDTQMKGMDVFGFSISDVPKLMKNFMEEFEVTSEDFDFFTLHQANKYILKQISRKVKIPMEKIPISLDRYGNNSSNSIPLVICDHLLNAQNKTFRLFMSGFGAGLSWACGDIHLDSDKIFPIIITDNYFKG